MKGSENGSAMSETTAPAAVWVKPKHMYPLAVLYDAKSETPENTIVTMRFDLQPGNLVARPAQLFQLHKNIHEFGNKTIRVISLLLQEMKNILRASLRREESA
eukprot:1142486-Pelagomonas_calceolata.AAC.2